MVVTLVLVCGVQLGCMRFGLQPFGCIPPFGFHILVGRLMPPHLFLAAVKQEVAPLPTNAIHGVIAQFPRTPCR